MAAPSVAHISTGPVTDVFAGESQTMPSTATNYQRPPRRSIPHHHTSIEESNNELHTRLQGTCSANSSISRLHAQAAAENASVPCIGIDATQRGLATQSRWWHCPALLKVSGTGISLQGGSAPRQGLPSNHSVGHQSSAIGPRLQSVPVQVTVGHGHPLSRLCLSPPHPWHWEAPKPSAPSSTGNAFNVSQQTQRKTCGNPMHNIFSGMGREHNSESLIMECPPTAM